jgi:hypothetical protein
MYMQTKSFHLNHTTKKKEEVQNLKGRWPNLSTPALSTYPSDVWRIFFIQRNNGFHSARDENKSIALQATTIQQM